MQQTEARQKASALRERGKSVVAKTLRETPAGHVTGGWSTPKDTWEVFYQVPGTTDAYLPWFDMRVAEVVDPADHE
jgi:hypothetical protein